MNSEVIGHQAAMNVFRNAARTHAFLFVGPDSIGKFTVALELAGEAVGCHGLDRTRACPDRIVVEPRRETEKGVTKEKSLAVADVRVALRELSLLPYVGDRRVLIVRDAHLLTEEAQNAILKTLEEPPVYATVILTTHAEGRLLPTLHSRCQRIMFHAVDETEMRQAFSGLTDIPDILFSLGRPGIARSFSDHEDEIREDLDRLNELGKIMTLSGKRRLDLAEILTKDAGRLMRVLDWWVCLLEGQGGSNPGDLILAGKIAGLLEQVRRKPGNARVLLESVFVSL